MKRYVTSIGSGVLVLGIVASLAMIPNATGQTTIVWNQATVAWDPVTTDVQGNPEVIRDAELGIWASGVNHQTTAPIAVLSNLPGTPPIGGVSLGNLFTGRPIGDYQLAVRVHDMAGNVSAWSSALVGRFDPAPPTAPSGFRVVVTVEIIPR